MNVSPRNRLTRSMLVLSTAILLSSPLYAATVLISDFEDASVPVYTYSGNNSYVNAHYVNFLVHEGAQAMQVDNQVYNYTGSLLALTGDPADWTDAETLSMWVHANANDNGKTFNVVVEDANQEQFTHTVAVNWQGWYQVSIPVASFVSRTDWQPPGAVINGVIDSPVMTLHFMALSYNTQLTLFFDLIELTTAEPDCGNELISVSSAGVQGENYSSGDDISDDGRYVVFLSYADNLTPEDTTMSHGDVFVRDRLTGETTLVSKASDGTPGNDHSSRATISGDGRYVAFASFADNLVPNDTNIKDDVFVHDRQTGETWRISEDASGVGGNRSSTYPDFSADGRYVAFESEADNLVAGDTNGYDDDIFVYDMVTDSLTLVSVSSSGAQGTGYCDFASLSADGRYVAFGSTVSTLVPDDTNGAHDVFVRDLVTGETWRASVNNLGVESNGVSGLPKLSADGQYVAFFSTADNLVSGDTNSALDIFVFDNVIGETIRASVDSNGNESNGASLYFDLSADGEHVFFSTDATNLVPDDTNGFEDVFEHNLVTGVTSRVVMACNDAETNERSLWPLSSADGSVLVYTSDATNLVSVDANGMRDVFATSVATGSTTGINLGAVNDDTYFTVTGSQDFIIDSLTFNGWTPTKIVVGIGQTDGLPLTGVSMSVDGGAPFPVYGNGGWDEIEIPFTGQSVITFTIYSTSTRQLRTEWWATN